MKLWILEPIGLKGNNIELVAPDWMFWEDNCFGMVIRARTEKRARQIASQNGGLEDGEVWLNPKKTTCLHLTVSGKEKLVMQDIAVLNGL